MKSIWFCVIIALLLFFVSSCSEVIIEIDKEQIECGYSGILSSQYLTINTSTNWQASVSEDWVTIKPTEGKKGETKIKVSAKDNDTYDQRTATISIKAGNKSETVLIIQGQRDIISISTTSISLSPDSQEFSPIVSSNVVYETDIDVDWIHLVKTKALSEIEYTFLADENLGFDSRMGVIEFYNSEIDIKNYIYINQQARDSIETNVPEVLFDWTGGTQDILVKANIETELSYSDGWASIYKTGNNRSFVISVFAPCFELHPDSLATGIVGDKRIADISITGNSLERTIRISQSYRHYIWINKTEVTLLQGETTQLHALGYLPEGITDDLVWQSDNPGIASVDNGLIRAVGIGETTIQVSSKNGEFSTNCKIIVRDPISDISFGTYLIHLTQSGGVAYFDYGSSLILPSMIEPRRIAIQYVLFCRPDGVVVERITNFSGYQWYMINGRYTLSVNYNTLIHYGSLTSQDLSYYNRWYGVCYYTVDGVLYHSPH